MLIRNHSNTKILQSIKSQLPILTEEDIIISLNIIYINATEENDIVNMINNISEYYQEKDEKFDSQLFKKNLHIAIQYINQTSLSILKDFICLIMIINLFNHNLLFNDFNDFIRKQYTNIEFLISKIEMIKNDTISCDKKISLCNDLNKVNKVKEQLNNNFEILKHFKLICENHHSVILNIYNFIANQLKYFTIDEKYKNKISLTSNEYEKIKALISSENKFKDILIKDSNSEIPYKLNINEVQEILKGEFKNLFNEYESKIFDFKNDKSKRNGLKIKGIKLKIKNIFDLSQIIFEIFKKPFTSSLPLTKIVNKILNGSDTVKYLNGIDKNIDITIELIEKLRQKLQLVSNPNHPSEKETLVQFKNMNSFPDVNIEQGKVKKRKKKKKNSKKNENLKVTKTNETDNLQSPPVSSALLVEQDIIKINTILEKNNSSEQSIKQEDDTNKEAPEIISQDQILWAKINDLEAQLKQTQEKLQGKIENMRDKKNKTIEKLRKKESTLILEKEKLQNENHKNNQELLFAQHTLIAEKNKNKKLLTEVNELKQEKIKLETTKEENDIQIKEKQKIISLLESELATINHQLTAKVEKIIREKKQLVCENKKLENLNKKNNQKLTNLVNKLKQKIQTLSQDDQNLATFTNSYDIKSCIYINPMIEKKLVLKPLLVSEMIEVVAPVSILVPTGQQFLVNTEHWEEVHSGNEVIPGFCLQPKLFTM